MDVITLTTIVQDLFKVVNQQQAELSYLKSHGAGISGGTSSDSGSSSGVSSSELTELNEKYNDLLAKYEANKAQIDYFNSIIDGSGSVNRPWVHIPEEEADDIVIPPKNIEDGEVFYITGNSQIIENGMNEIVTLRFKDAIYDGFYINNTKYENFPKIIICDLNIDGLSRSSVTSYFSKLITTPSKVQQVIFTNNHNYTFPCTPQVYANLNNFYELEELDLTWFDFSNARTLIFQNNYKIKKYYNLKNKIFNELNTMNNMFQNNYALEEVKLLNLTGKDISILTNAFQNCSSLKTVEMPNLISKVAQAVSTFEGCSELEYINLSNLDTSKLGIASKMFYNCSKLKRIDGILNLVSIINCTDMFTGCDSLEHVKITGLGNKTPAQLGLKEGQYEIY